MWQWPIKSRLLALPGSKHSPRYLLSPLAICSQNAETTPQRHWRIYMALDVVCGTHTSSLHKHFSSTIHWKLKIALTPICYPVMLHCYCSQHSTDAITQGERWWQGTQDCQYHNIKRIFTFQDLGGVHSVKYPFALFETMHFCSLINNLAIYDISKSASGNMKFSHEHFCSKTQFIMPLPDIRATFWHK